MILAYLEIESPVGPLRLVASASSLVAILWKDERFGRVRLEPMGPHEDPPHAPHALVLRAAARQLEEYFSGERREFTVPLDPIGTDFQKRVWRELSRIPYARTASYGEIARAVGSPGAARAVGAANGRNPLSIIVPCHRAIGSDGKMVGFAAGLPAKRTLLALEARNGDRRPQAT